MGAQIGAGGSRRARRSLAEMNVTPLVGVMLVLALREVEVPVIPRRLIRFDARPTILAYQQAADRQGVVADHLRRQAKARLSSHQTIVGISLAQVRRFP